MRRDAMLFPMMAVKFILLSLLHVHGLQAQEAGGRVTGRVMDQAILQFYFVGMEGREIAVDDRKVIDVVMEENTSKEMMPAKPILLIPKQREKAEAARFQ